MTDSVPHLVDIRTLGASTLPDLVISRRGELVVSRFKHPSWDLSPYIRTRNTRGATIRFDVTFHDGSVLTEDRHATLLHASKWFLYERWRVKGPHSGKNISAKTLFNNWSQLRRLLKWMIRNGVSSFAEMTSERCLCYANESKGSLKDSSRGIAMQILTTYYDLRDYLKDRLPAYPWGSTSAFLIVKGGGPVRRQAAEGAATQIVPARILQLIARNALDYIETRAESLLNARDEILEIRKQEYQKLIDVHRTRYPRGFSSIYKSEEAYLGVRLGHLSAAQSKEVVSSYGLRSLDHLKEEIVHLRTACYIVCAVFSGMRDSELASLEVGCFAEKVGFDGENFCWLSGKTYKLEQDPKPSTWMVPKIVGKAVAVATRLGAPDRTATIKRIAELKASLDNPTVLDIARQRLTKELHECLRHQNALLTTTKEKGRTLALGGGANHNALRAFALLSNAIVIQEDMEGIQDHEKVSIGKPWPLAPHQFRRTFAVFVARNLMGDVRYLREHFKHWSIDMTLYYSKHEASVDSTVMDQILFERDELQSALLGTWIDSGKPLSGGAGKRIVAFRDRGEVKAVKTIEAFCRRLGADVFIRGTGHSWCLASGSGCGGQGLYDAVRCTSCGEGVIDDNNIQIWRGIRDQQIEVLNCSDLGMPARQRCVDHLLAAEHVLADLGDLVEPYSVSDVPPRGVSRS